MENIVLIILLFSKASSVAAQFNGYNCDANFHSRFPGEIMTGIYTYKEKRITNERPSFQTAWQVSVPVLDGSSCNNFFYFSGEGHQRLLRRADRHP